MGVDDSGTLAALKAHRRELIDPKIAEHDGRIVKTTGDGLLLEFPSVVDAVRCGVDLQRGMTERNEGIAPDKRLEFRIGINVGDIIIDGDDIFGDGVNVAARLEALADPGGICVSRVVRDQVFDKLSFTFEDLGAQQVKNIARPVEVYRVDLGSALPPTASRGRRRWLRLTRAVGWRLRAGVLALAVAGIAVWAIAAFWKTPPTPTPPPFSIAILPFASPTDSAADEQLADRITQDLGSALGRLSRSGRVVSHSAVATYKAKAIDARSVGRELNVRYLVEGDVRRAGERVGVNVHLIDTSNATQVWSDRLELEQSRVTQEQGGLVAQLTNRLYDALRRAERRRAAGAPAPGASAMDLTMHAWAVWDRDDNTLSGALEARRWFDQALKLDADFVLALTGRVRTLEYELDLDPHADRDRLVQEMDALSFRAVSIDPESPSAWAYREDVLERQWRWDAAIEANVKSQKLDPSNDWPLNRRAGIMIYTGQPAQALPLVDQQLALDPQAKESLGWAALQQCRAYMALGRYDEAIVSCEKDVALDNWWLPHVYLLAAYAQKGEATRAVAEKTALLKLRPEFSIADFRAQRFSDHPAYLQQTETHLYAGLRKAGIPEN